VRTSNRLVSYISHIEQQSAPGASRILHRKLGREDSNRVHPLLDVLYGAVRAQERRSVVMFLDLSSRNDRFTVLPPKRSPEQPTVETPAADSIQQRLHFVLSPCGFGLSHLVREKKHQTRTRTTGSSAGSRCCPQGRLSQPCVLPQIHLDVG
jgi:hypothetical protein